MSGATSAASAWHAGLHPRQGVAPGPARSGLAALTGQIREKISLLASGMARRLHRAGVTVRRAWAQLDALPESDYYLLALGKPPRPLPRVPGKTLYTPASILHLGRAAPGDCHLWRRRDWGGVRPDLCRPGMPGLPV